MKKVVDDDVVFLALVAALDAAGGDLVDAGVGGDHLVPAKIPCSERWFIGCVIKGITQPVRYQNEPVEVQASDSPGVTVVPEPMVGWGRDADYRQVFLRSARVLNLYMYDTVSILTIYLQIFKSKFGNLDGFFKRKV